MKWKDIIQTPEFIAFGDDEKKYFLEGIAKKYNVEPGEETRKIVDFGMEQSRPGYEGTIAGRGWNLGDAQEDMLDVDWSDPESIAAGARNLLHFVDDDQGFWAGALQDVIASGTSQSALTAIPAGALTALGEAAVVGGTAAAVPTSGVGALGIPLGLGLMAGGSALGAQKEGRLEYGPYIIGALSEAGVNPKDQYEVARFMKDNPDMYEEFKKKAALSGVGTGGVAFAANMLAPGVGSRFVKGARTPVMKQVRKEVAKDIAAAVTPEEKVAARLAGATREAMQRGTDVAARREALGVKQYALRTLIGQNVVEVPSEGVGALAGNFLAGDELDWEGALHESTIALFSAGGIQTATSALTQSMNAVVPEQVRQIDSKMAGSAPQRLSDEYFEHITRNAYPEDKLEALGPKSTFEEMVASLEGEEQSQFIADVEKRERDFSGGDRTRYPTVEDYVEAQQAAHSEFVEANFPGAEIVAPRATDPVNKSLESAVGKTLEDVGNEVIYIDSDSDTAGYYEGNKVIINTRNFKGLDPMTDVLKTGMHEMVHHFEQASPEAYKALETSAKKLMPQEWVASVKKVGEGEALAHVLEANPIELFRAMGTGTEVRGLNHSLLQSAVNRVVDFGLAVAQRTPGLSTKANELISNKANLSERQLQQEMVNLYGVMKEEKLVEAPVVEIEPQPLVPAIETREETKARLLAEVDETAIDQVDSETGKFRERLSAKAKEVDSLNAEIKKIKGSHEALIKRIDKQPKQLNAVIGTTQRANKVMREKIDKLTARITELEQVPKKVEVIEPRFKTEAEFQKAIAAPKPLEHEEAALGRRQAVLRSMWAKADDAKKKVIEAEASKPWNENWLEWRRSFAIDTPEFKFYKEYHKTLAESDIISPPVPAPKPGLPTIDLKGQELHPGLQVMNVKVTKDTDVVLTPDVGLVPTGLEDLVSVPDVESDLAERLLVRANKISEALDFENRAQYSAAQVESLEAREAEIIEVQAMSDEDFREQLSEKEKKLDTLINRLIKQPDNLKLQKLVKKTITSMGSDRRMKRLVTGAIRRHYQDQPTEITSDMTVAVLAELQGIPPIQQLHDAMVAGATIKTAPVTHPEFMQGQKAIEAHLLKYGYEPLPWSGIQADRKPPQAVVWEPTREVLPIEVTPDVIEKAAPLEEAQRDVLEAPRGAPASPVPVPFDNAKGEPFQETRHHIAQSRSNEATQVISNTEEGSDYSVFGSNWTSFRTNTGRYNESDVIWVLADKADGDTLSLIQDALDTGASLMLPGHEFRNSAEDYIAGYITRLAPYEDKGNGTFSPRSFHRDLNQMGYKNTGKNRVRSAGDGDTNIRMTPQQWMRRGVDKAINEINKWSGRRNIRISRKQEVSLRTLQNYFVDKFMNYGDVLKSDQLLGVADDFDAHLALREMAGANARIWEQVQANHFVPLRNLQKRLGLDDKQIHDFLLYLGAPEANVEIYKQSRVSAEAARKSLMDKFQASRTDIGDTVPTWSDADVETERVMLEADANEFKAGLGVTDADSIGALRVFMEQGLLTMSTKEKGDALDVFAQTYGYRDAEHMENSTPEEQIQVYEDRWITPGEDPKETRPRAPVKLSGKLGMFQAAYNKTTEAQIAHLERNGLITPDEASNLRNAKQYYAAVKRPRDLDEDWALRNVGKKFGVFDVRGKDIQGTAGRELGAPVEDIISQTQADFMSAITRGTQAKVGQALLEYTEAYGHPDIEVLTELPTGRIYTREGLMYSGLDKFGMEANDMFGVKRNGKQHWLKLKDERLATALKNLDATQGGLVIKAMRTATKWMSRAATQFNPEFLFMTNPQRDMMWSLFMAAGKDIPGSVSEIVGPTASYQSWKALFSAEQHLGQRTSSSEYANWVQEYLDGYAKMGNMGTQDPGKIRNDINKLANEFREVDYTHDGETDFAGYKRIYSFMGVVKTIGAAATGIENMFRLNAFVAARKRGMSQRRAAQVARSLTVDFNQHGSSQFLSAAWMFANAGIQGSTRFFNAYNRSKGVRRVVNGIVATSVLNAYMNRMVLGKDEDGRWIWDKRRRHVTDREFTVYLPGDSKIALTWAMPWGFNVPAVMGQEVERMLFNQMTGEKIDPAEAASHITNAAISSFNPLGGSMNSGTEFFNMLLPSVARPWDSVRTNKSWTGLNIHTMFHDDALASAEQGRPATSPSEKAFAKFVNKATFGSRYRSGAFDMYPEDTTYLLTAYTGGITRMLEKVVTTKQQIFNKENNEPWDMNKIVFVGKWFEHGRTGSMDQGEFYTEIRKVKRIRKDYEEMRKTDPEKAAAFYDAFNPYLQGYVDAAFNRANRQKKKAETQEQIRRAVLPALAALRLAKKKDFDG